MIRIRRRENEIPMSSMSDIAFLLIVFFIITISFIYKQGLQIVLPKKDSKPVVVNVKDILLLSLEEDGSLFLDKKKTSVREIPVGGRSSAIITVDRKCRYGKVVGLIDYLQKNGVYKLSIKKK